VVSSVTNSGGALDKNSFLQLMVTEMQNQDPLQPQDSNQFLNQLAQFTTMEQMMNIEQTNTQMLQVNQMAFEHSLIGQTVSVTDADGNSVTGQVTGIQLNSGDPQLVINGNAYSLDSMTGMSGAAQPTPIEVTP
jgi:flagellar basal-body rod modification protein FlgD